MIALLVESEYSSPILKGISFNNESPEELFRPIKLISFTGFDNT